MYIYSAFENDDVDVENEASSGVNRITISFSNTEQQKKKNTKKTEIKALSLSLFTRAKHVLSRKETEEREERERETFDERVMRTVFF